jgi:hypothetical protein
VVRDISELAFELSRRSLTQQEGALNELRARTGTVLAASALVASFLGGRAVAAPGHGWLTGVGFALFALSVASSAWVLWPKSGLVFALRGSVLFREEADDPEGLPETERRLATWIEEYIDENQLIIDRLFVSYRMATLSVLAQVGIWLLKLGVS